MTYHSTKILFAAALFAPCAAPLNADQPPTSVLEFLKSNCYDCHDGDQSEAGFDLSKLPTEFAKTDVAKWIRMIDRIHDVEMPPQDYAELDPDERDRFLKEAGGWIRSEQKKEFQTDGRVRAKRLTNLHNDIASNSWRLGFRAIAWCRDSTAARQCFRN